MVEDIYPLSPLQEGLLFHALSGDRGLYFEQLRCTLVGELDLPAFEQTWRRLVERHAVLRTAFDWEDAAEPVQVVLGRVELPIVHHDWRALPPAEQQERLAALLAEDLARGFELDEPPLMRLCLARTAADVHRLVWSFHHLLLDGWSSPLLLAEAFTVYDALRRGEEPSLPPVRPYRDYVAWLKAQGLERARGFWQGLLAGFTRPTRLQIDRPVEARQGVGTPPAAGRNLTLRLDAGETARLLAFARRHQLTLNTLVQGAWARLLACYGESEDVVFGVTVSGRPPQLRGVETMVGLFINSLPLRLTVPPAEPLLPWLRRLQDLLSAMRQYEYAPLSMVQGWSDAPRGRPLFDSLLVFENMPMGEALSPSIEGLEIRDVDLEDRTNYPFTLVVSPGEKLAFDVLYDGGRFAAAAVRRLLGHLESLLRGMAEGPGRSLGELPLMAQAEKQAALAAGQRRKRLPPGVQSLLRKAAENDEAGNDEKKGTPV